MKKNAFTLTELLAVIAILAIIMLLATGTYSAVQKNITIKTCNNLKTYLEEGALQYIDDYGYDESAKPKISDLISKGYITPDDGDDIKNPVNQESLLNEVINYNSSNENVTLNFNCE